jgi:hypothetical protein
MTLVQNIVNYMLARGDKVFTDFGKINIVYLEGANLDGTENTDAPDRWNDASYLFTFSDGKPVLLFTGVATTEPGIKATNTDRAKKLGGVARICLGQQTAWKIGFHKGLPAHPALVQRAPVLVRRDRNKDFIRTGDPETVATGINQHSTAPGYMGGSVGYYSEGCLVRKFWGEHMEFMHIVATDPDSENPDFLFTTAVYGADDFNRYVRSQKV